MNKNLFDQFFSSNKKILRCKYKECEKSLKNENAATNFKNPTLSVKRAIKEKIIHSGQTILEFGSGNLRNSIFILENISDVKIFAYDIKKTIKRFLPRYDEFFKLGGELYNKKSSIKKFDIIISTFVLETICPSEKRKYILSILKNSLNKKGILICSFRGYPGVKGSKYKKCKLNEGYITPLYTFVKPYSLSELENIFSECGYDFMNPFQNYKVNCPQNIHLMAGLRNIENDKY